MATETMINNKRKPAALLGRLTPILAPVWRPLANLGGRVKRFGTRFGVLFLGISVVLVAGNLGYGMWELSFQPGFCNGCHLIRPYVDSYQTSAHLDNLHMQAGTVCKDCHHVSPQEALREVVAYVGGDYRDPMPEKNVPKESCLECHRSYQSLIERTAYLEPNPHNSHFGELECSMCHNSHRESTLFCSECHTWDLTPR